MKVLKCIVFIIILLFSITYSNYAYAQDSIVDLGHDWLDEGESGGGSDVFDYINHDTKNGFLDLASVLRGIGIFVGAAVGIILGIKFMLSSATQRAEIKELLVPYIVGVSIILGAVVIWQILINILDV